MRQRIAILALVLLAFGSSADAGWERRYRQNGVVYQSGNRPVVRYTTPYRTYVVPQPTRYIRTVPVRNVVQPRWVAPVPTQSPFPPPPMF